MKKDHKTTIDQLRKKITEFRDKRDWKQFHDPQSLAAALSTEVAELLELFRFKNKKEVQAMIKDKKKKARVAEELAHVIWQSLNFSDITGIDISSSLEKALKEAAKKYPVKKFKGVSKKYNEI